MTEKESEQLFAQLDTIDVDSYTRKAMDSAALIEELLNSDEGEQDELTELTVADLVNESIAEMDRGCPYFNQSVLVTGTLKKAYFDEMTQKFATEDVVVERESLVSFGYSTLVYGTVEDGTAVYKVGNLFLLEEMPPRNDTPPLVDYVPRIFGFAPAGQVTIEYEMGDHDNIEALQTKIPSILEEIDNLIANAEDESAALLSLAEYTLSREQDIPDDILSALLSYVTNRLALDPTLPYQIRIDGVVYSTVNGELTYCQYERPKEDDALIVYPAGLSLRPYPSLEGNQLTLTDDWYWCVDMAVLGRKINDETLHISVPIKNMLAMKPVREILHNR